MTRAAFETAHSRYTFSIPDPGEIGLRVPLLFRRACKDLMDQKKLNVPNILMQEAEISVLLDLFHIQRFLAPLPKSHVELDRLASL